MDFIRPIYLCAWHRGRLYGFQTFCWGRNPQGGGDLNVLAQSEGETQQVSPQVKKACRVARALG